MNGRLDKVSYNYKTGLRLSYNYFALSVGMRSLL